MVLDMRQVPTFAQGLRQLLVIILAEAILFYPSHRLLHRAANESKFKLLAVIVPSVPGVEMDDRDGTVTKGFNAVWR